MTPLHKMAVPVGYGGVIARFIGQGCVALGFILGIYGLTEDKPDVLNAGLLLLIAGILASAYGLYCWIRRVGVRHDHNRAQ
jgi:hypothetical protein